MGSTAAIARVNKGRSHLRMETFGFSFAEDAAAVALGEDSKLLGERRLKEQFIPEQQPRSLLTDGECVVAAAAQGSHPWPTPPLTVLGRWWWSSPEGLPLASERSHP